MMPRAAKPEQPGMSAQSVSEFELVSSQIDHFHSELHALAKGKSNDALNPFKLDLLNQLLTRANQLLGQEYQAVPGFSTFERDQIPSTSDALLVLSQYIGALEKLRTDNITVEMGRWRWVIDGVPSDVRTAPPAKLNNR